MTSAAPAPDYEAQLGTWVRGIPSELRFWDNWVTTRGAQWPEDFVARTDPDRRLALWEPELAELLVALGPAARVLDVGAGPLTVLGRQGPHGPVAMEACDPLALAYHRILDRHGVVPLVATVPAQVETLSLRYAEASFDIVHCRNALDHAFDPVAGIFEMLRVVRPGGVVLLRHEVDEAVNESYDGLHQWNLRCEGDAFVAWNPRFRFDVSAMLAGAARVHALADRGMLSVRLTRIGAMAPTPRLMPLPEQQAGWIDLACRLIAEAGTAAPGHAQFARIRQESALLAAERDAARAEIATLHGSRSWRLTAPLRRALGMLRRQ